MKATVATLLAVFSAASINAASIGDNSYFTQPALSPNGDEIAFVSNGDIWSVAASGGKAQLLVSGEAAESRPLYSPDGKRLAFISMRSGNGDIHVLDFASGKLARITWDDGFDNLSAWSRDGEWLYFSSTRDNVGGMNGVFRVRASGGTPMPVSKEDYRNHEGAAPSPDGREIALSGNGTGERQWWRNGHSNLETGAIWLLRDDGKHAYQRITPDDARALWPMWNSDGTAIYYMSDRSGHENLWRTTREGSPVAITQFADGRLLWPSISADGRKIAFARDFGIWTLDVASGQANPLAISLRGATTLAASSQQALSKDFSELSVAPDGKKLAFIARGEVFAASTDKGGRADRITRSDAAEFHVSWAPDSKRLVYAAARGAQSQLYLYEFSSGKETALTDGKLSDMRPHFSPDGKQLAFVRDSRQLVVIDLATRKERTVVSAAIDLTHPLESDRPFAWSPDSRWIAYQAYGERMFRNAWVVPVDGGQPQAVSFLANTGADSITWAPDGKSLMFTTGQRTETSQVARVDLLPRTPKFIEEQFRNLFDEQKDPVSAASAKSEKDSADKPSQVTSAGTKKEPVRIDAENIRNRLALLPTGLNVNTLEISPDGKSVLLTAESGGRTNLYLYPMDELSEEPAVPRQLTSSAGPKVFAQFSGDGKTVYMLEAGRIVAINVEDGKSRAIAVSAELVIDFDTEKQVVFDQSWRWLRDGFHDVAMNAVNWSAMRELYAPLLENARTPETMRDLLNLMIGELNASHTGVRPPGSAQLSTGRLGLHFEREEYERNGRLRVSSIVPLSAVDVAGKVNIGDVLLSVDGNTLSPSSNLDQVLDARTGRETKLEFAAATGGKSFPVRVKPIDSRSEAALAYRAWVGANRAYVEKASGGRLGYVHMFDMSMDSLQRLYVDLDAGNATREGVVIDVRNNFGGFVNAYALDVFTRQPYLNFRFRGQSVASARSVLGQRALERKTVLVTNRVTLSDGEDFSEGYRRLGLGKIVGEPTSGWIIYTSNVPLIDGSTLRIPFITVTTADGKPMEMAPRPVDVPVARPLGEAYRNLDSELDTAVRVLLQGAAGGG